LRIVVLGVGVQGTVFAVRLARFGHQVTLVARPERAEELRRQGAVIQDLKTTRTSSQTLPVLTELPPDIRADFCLVTVRWEQLETALPALAAASGIPRIVFLVNHANGSDDLVKLLGSARTVLAFPGIAGAREDGVVRYLDIPQQRTVVQASAHDVISLFREAGFPVEPVRDMDAWLQRHAVFITAIAGALYQNGCNAARLGQDSAAVCRLIVAVREGWAAWSRRRVGPAPFALRMIFCWMPLWFSAWYWRQLFASPDGDLYFARHARHAPLEMAALAAEVRTFLRAGEAPELQRLLASIDAWASEASLIAQPDHPA
jgi:2-dehydropantoate 2-reductase